MAQVPRRYVPKEISKKERLLQIKQLRKSRKNYKRGIYHTRKKLNSFKSRESHHVRRAKKMYGVASIKPSAILARRSGCTEKALRDIVRKGKGAYFSSGSRPNQTGTSWGVARLASAITGGPAARVDMHILKKGCSSKSKALRLARSTRKVRKVKNKVQIGGAKMKERIVKFMRGTSKGKKYTAIVENRKTKKMRRISFGAIGYQQYKDRTPLKLYANGNHGNKKRMENYFNRHSGTKKRSEAIRKEKRRSRGFYTPKILSHEYLW
mgnify:CR=1 FL=1